MPDRLALIGLVSVVLHSTACASASLDAAPADRVVDAPGAGDGPFRDPALATNGVRGGGLGAGSLDVYSIDYGSYLVLGWGGRRALNGPGEDLAVFENPFEHGDGATFMDPAIVEVSLDGQDWVALPHDLVAEDEARFSTRATDWRGFAGVTPVSLHAETNPVDPFDGTAGGDRFDLDALPGEGLAGAIREGGFAFVRLSPAFDHDNPDTGAPFPRDPSANGPDIDGVIARWVEVE